MAPRSTASAPPSQPRQDASTSKGSLLSFVARGAGGLAEIARTAIRGRMSTPLGVLALECKRHSAPAACAESSPAARGERRYYLGISGLERMFERGRLR